MTSQWVELPFESGGSGSSFITSVSDTNTINLTVTAGDLTADLNYVDSTTINFSDSVAGFTGSVITQMSITSDASGVKLVNDSATPGNSKYYGTDSGGTRGYFSLPSPGTGTVTSVALADGSGTPIYNISGSPVTTAGTLTFTLGTQSANKVFSGPTIGGAAQPTFRSLVAADLPTGDLTDAGTDGITITGGTSAVIGSGTSISQHIADSTHNGYLSSTDWATFNSKQAAGNYITALTGDGTAAGPGSVAFTLATVNGNVGTFGSSTSIPTFTVNAKGLITAASGNVVIAPAGTLTGTTLASNVVTSSLTAVGTITTGVWNGTVVGPTFGGTGQTSYTKGDILYASAANTLSKLAATTDGFVLTLASGVPSWAAGGSGSGTVNNGTAGRLTLYPATGTTVDDVYVQNSQNIDIAIATQASRSVALEYTVPNPGDAITSSTFVLTNAGVGTTGWIPYPDSSGTLVSSTVISVDLSASGPRLIVSGSSTQSMVDVANTGNPNLEAAVKGAMSGGNGENYGIKGSNSSTHAKAYSVYASEHIYLGDYADFKTQAAASTSAGATAGVTTIWVDTSGFFHQAVNGVVVDPFRVSSLKAAAGTTGVAPIQFTSGTNMTTAGAGVMEYDGVIHYATPVTNERGVLGSMQHITLTTAYTDAGSNTVNLRALFNAPANGALTVSANRTYYFECMYTLSALSALTGSFGFGLAGSATYTRVAWQAIAKYATAALSAPSFTFSTVPTNTQIALSAGTPTTGEAYVYGKIVIGTGGTIIPSYSNTRAVANVVVGVDSYFKIWPAGSNTVQSVGNWS